MVLSFYQQVLNLDQWTKAIGIRKKEFPVERIEKWQN